MLLSVLVLLYLWFNKEFNTPTHNSIGPVKLLKNEGVNVGLGIDNIQDIFMLSFVMVTLNLNYDY